jgi:hypothetical protein
MVLVGKKTNLYSLACLRNPPLFHHVCCGKTKNEHMIENFFDENKSNNTNEQQHQHNNQTALS